MDCKTFIDWLENRDLHDISESDKAMKHAADCTACMTKMEFDEKLDKLLFSALEPVDLPDSLVHKVDVSLDRVGIQSEKKSQ